MNVGWRWSFSFAFEATVSWQLPVVQNMLSTARLWDRTCTDLNSLCYNSFTEHGQMLGVAIACGRFLAVLHTVHLLSIRYRKLVIFGGTD
jgi:hypothetical protein